PVQDAVRIGRKLYIACLTRWAWREQGGLIVHDLDTGLTQRLSESDGLKNQKLKALRADGERLHILYEVQRASRHEMPRGAVVLHSEDQYRCFTFKSDILDTRTGKLGAGEETLPVPPELKDRRNAELRGLPFLGGRLTVDATHAGKRILAGERGLV